ncbi:MAG: exonuclease SbcCD subunit D [Thermodesulfobacteriota bacterium]|nr:exonuclease SbcCD subunit D [Thermodesulfobacteriota bacterium]
MRLIHTADWHLGRLFHGRHLTEDQAHVLDQLVDLVREFKPDAVLVAGDVFDRAVPPPDAVRLLDDVLSRIVLGLQTPVILIAGNHDSPARLGFGSQVLARSGLHIFGTVTANVKPVLLEDEAGPVAVYPLPYAEPALVRERLGSKNASDHNAAMTVRVQGLAAQDSPGRRSIVMAHAFVSGGTESESERPLSLGGVGTIEAALFQKFDFAALGHLHRPQTSEKNKFSYSGSLLKYSFSEVNDRKSVNLVEMAAGGGVQVQKVPLTPRRDLRRVEGYLEDLIENPAPGENKEDYLLVTLLDKGAILDAMGRLRQVYPNALHIERPSLDIKNHPGRPFGDHRGRTDAELFASFFYQVTGDELSIKEEQAFAGIVEDWRRRDRED